MFGQTFGHRTLRKYVIFFGTLFNNVWLRRYNASGQIVQNMKVPLNYGPREKFLARLDGNPEFDRQIAIQLPRMSFEMTNLYYDSQRKLSSINKIYAANPQDPTRAKYQFNPVPYNIEFTLSILVKNAEDGTYIVEQILPFFTPEWTATLNINADMGTKYDVPVVLESVTSEDSYEGAFTERRAIIWSLTFTMKGYLFGPTKTTGPGTKFIKDIDINLYDVDYDLPIDQATATNSDLVGSVQVTPGAYSNGTALSDPLNTWTYQLANSTGTFVTGELLTVNSSAYTYVVEANSTTVQVRNVEGNIAANSVLTGEYGFSATVNSVSVSPARATSNSIYYDSNYGFIVDFMDYQ